MKRPQPLGTARLYVACPADSLPFETTDELQQLEEVIGQQRALDAVHFGIGMRSDGYNLFVLGPPGLGKHTLIRRYLEQAASAAATPSDWCYVNNFAQAHAPRALRLPPARGLEFHGDMEQLIDDLRTAIPASGTCCLSIT